MKENEKQIWASSGANIRINKNDLFWSLLREEPLYPAFICSFISAPGTVSGTEWAPSDIHGMNGKRSGVDWLSPGFTSLDTVSWRVFHSVGFTVFISKWEPCAGCLVWPLFNYGSSKKFPFPIIEITIICDVHELFQGISIA